MNFIEAVIKISQTKGFEFCDDEDELKGDGDICVYHNDQFAGKLRWPDVHRSRRAKVDKELENRLSLIAKEGQ